MTGQRPGDRVTSLDELLSYDDGYEPDTRSSAGVRRWSWWVRTVLISVAIAAVARLMLHVVRADVPIALLFGVTFVLQVLHRILALVAAPRLPPTLLEPVGSPRATGRARPTGPPDGLLAATARWETRLAWSRLQTDPEQFTRTVKPHLVELLDERLRLRHGVVRAADPQRARALMDERLWRFVTQPVRSKPTMRELATLIKLMEDV